MSWNYRVIQFMNESTPYYEVCEVYYDEHDEPHSWSKDHNHLCTETVKDLKWTYKEIHKAFEKPFLRLHENGTLVEMRKDEWNET